MFICFIGILAVFKSLPVNFSKSFFKWFDGFFIIVRFGTFWTFGLWQKGSSALKAIAIGKYSVLKMTVLNWQSNVQFTMIWSIAVAECFPTLMGWFIVGIMLYQHIKFAIFCPACHLKHFNIKCWNHLQE